MYMKIIPQSVIDRVKLLAAQFSGDGCWEWPRSRNPQTGYGHLTGRVNKKTMIFTAHRVSYHGMVAPIPDGMHVLHRCDNRGCFNPAHLFLGTHKDNMLDMNQKGRAGQRKNPARGDRHGSRTKPGRLPCGEANNKAKLTTVAVLEILASKERPNVLAARYGVSYITIYAIKRRKTWRHLTPPSQASAQSPTPKP